MVAYTCETLNQPEKTETEFYKATDNMKTEVNKKKNCVKISNVRALLCIVDDQQ